MIKRFLCIGLLFSTMAGIACLNLSGTNLSGEHTTLDMIYFDFEINEYPDQEQIDKGLASLREDLETAASTEKDELYTDIAAYMIYDGDYQEAIDYLHKNVQEKENNYSFYSNIGVAHELVGNLDSALYYTQKALIVDNASHGGSEWIHIRILQAEIAVEKNPNWMDNNSVLGFPISADSTPTVLPDTLSPYHFNDHLYFQLHERTYFVKPESQDPFVGQLLLLHADVIARYFDTDHCLPIYQLAADYDNSLQELVNQRVAYLNNFNTENGLEAYEYTDETGHNIRHDDQKNKNLSDEAISEPDEKPKKKKKVIKGLIYYLGAGFVLLLILMVFYLRKKPGK